MKNQINKYRDVLENVCQVVRAKYANQQRRDKFLKYIAKVMSPQRIIRVKVPLTRDDGKQKVFKGFRVQHSNARGPFKGGLRFHPEVSLTEMKSLAFWMSLKCSLVNISFGGAKGGVEVNPKELSKSELERLARSFVQQIHQYIGPQVDIPAPDVYTTPEIMGWMIDEYGKIKGKEERAVVTGKPLELGGSPGRDTATGQGAFYVFKNIISKIKLKKKDISIAINGFGNAGANFAGIAYQAGYKIVAVNDSSGAIYNEDGLDIASLIKYKNKSKKVSGFKNSKSITPEEMFKLAATVLVPASLADVINVKNASDIKAKVILEIANGPVSAQADKILDKNNVLVIPGILANAGGVIVSYFEWLQNINDQRWSLARVQKQLLEIITKASDESWAIMQKYQTSLRTATYLIALERLMKAEQKGNKTSSNK